MKVRWRQFMLCTLTNKSVFMVVVYHDSWTTKHNRPIHHYESKINCTHKCANRGNCPKWWLSTCCQHVKEIGIHNFSTFSYPLKRERVKKEYMISSQQVTWLSLRLPLRVVLFTPCCLANLDKQETNMLCKTNLGNHGLYQGTFFH